MKTVVIIPARGGSKGIPRKNLRPLAGKPLIYYSIRYSLECPEVDAVYVSTDDSEIALFAERFGAKVLMRPPQLADDKTTIDPVICNAVDELESQGKLFDIVVTVQPTSPLMTSKDISEGISMFQDSEVETVLSVQDDRHLRWKIENDIPVPEYQKRVNRQLGSSI